MWIKSKVTVILFVKTVKVWSNNKTCKMPSSFKVKTLFQVSLSYIYIMKTRLISLQQSQIITKILEGEGIFIIYSCNAISIFAILKSNFVKFQGLWTQKYEYCLSAQKSWLCYCTVLYITIGMKYEYQTPSWYGNKNHHVSHIPASWPHC